MKAAKEAQADVLAPVLYREASEWWQKAKAEYKYKNFEQAEEYAIKARKLAEQAEFEVIKNPSQRVEPNPEPPAPPTAPETPYPYPSPATTPFDRATLPPSGSGGSGTSGSDGSPTHIQVPPPTTP
jgi:hypothetical protein